MQTTGKKILVIDNDLGIQEATKAILENMGHHQVVTGSQNTLLHKLEEAGTPDLILLDYSLSDSDAEQLCKSLKSNEKTRNLPLLIFSTRLDVGNIYQTIGADDYLSKPFEVVNLLTKVNTLMASSSGALC